MKKVSVTVESERNANGVLIPKSVLWADGRRFDVSRVLFYSESSTGEYEGIRYTVMIGSMEKYIYRANQSWYVIALTGGVGSEETNYL